MTIGARWIHIAGVAALTAISTGTAFAQTPQFNRDDYASSPGTRAIVKGDFDGNGWTDVAIANTGRNSVALLLNAQDGTTGAKFVKGREWAAGTGPFDMTAGDFNRDGVLDLAVANADGNTIAIMMLAKNGIMTPHSIVTPGNPRGIETADVDRDGKLDIIYTAYQANSVTVLFGDGAGGFAARFAGTAVGPQPQGVVAGDFNNDGKIDLAVANAGGGLAVLTGDGAGHFTKRNVAGAQNINVLAAADVNHDGWLDAAAASQSSGAIGVYLGSAAGLTSLRVVYPAAGASPRGITIADVNGDGWPEILAANRASSTVSVLIGAAAAADMYTQATQFAAGSESRDLVAADFNHDGLLDIATGNETAGTTTVLTNVTQLDPPAFAFDPVSLAGFDNTCGSGADRLIAADFNHNGRLDLATSIECGRGVAVLLDGQTTTVISLTTSSGFMQIDDLNRDGNPDLALVQEYTGTGSTSLVTLLGDGRGGFTPVTGATVAAPYLVDLALGDVNRDGIADAITLVNDYTAQTSRLQVLLGRGDGTFAVSTPMPLFAFSYGLVAADADADGKVDLFTQSFSGATLYRGNGNGGFSSAYTFGPQGTILVADVNEDGVPDVLISQWDSVHVFAGVKTGGFAADVVHTGQTAQFLADMNADGHLDLVARGQSQSIAFGRGDGIWEPPQMFSGNDFTNLMVVADYNQDGLPDLLFTRWDGYSALINTRRTVNAAPTVNAGPDQTFTYDFAAAAEDAYELWANGKDPDGHALTYEWRDEQGQIVGREQYYALRTMPHGPHRFTVTASDGRGASATDEVVITIVPAKEIVVHAWQWSWEGSDWNYTDTPDAADGISFYNPNRNAAKASQASASPQSLVDVWFFADPTQTYKLWIRGKAENDSWANDSAFIQFSGAVDPNGNAAWQIGTTNALVFNLEECSGCGLSGWGWEDDGWGAVNRNGTLLRFPQGGYQRIRIQTREDGLSIDQVVLSAEKYLTTRPGSAKNDHTIVWRTQ